MKSKIYTLIVTIFLSVIQYTAFAQTTELASWDFAAGNTTPVLTTGISSASISVGGSLQRSYALTNSFLVTNIWATSQSQALNGSGTMAAQYISFRITPAANYSMDIASIGIQGYNPVVNHGKGFLPAYVDPITGNLVQLTSQAQSVSTATLNPTFTIPLTNITTPIEFRFYIYSYPPYPSDIVGFGEQPGADLVINGNVHSSATQVIPGTWSLQGNTVAGTQFLGSVNNQDLVIYTNNAEKMRIGANGNVGIGTSTLAQKLNVAGDIGITGDFYKNGTKLDFSSLGSWTQSGFQDLNPNSPTYNQTLGQLSNTPFKQKMVLNAGVVEINATVSAWQGISVGGRNQYSAGGPDLINSMPAYGIALNQSTGVVQVAGYNGINFVDNTFGTAPALSISNGNVTTSGMLTAKGGIKLQDGSILTSSNSNWNMTSGYLTYANNVNIQGKLKLGTGSLYLSGYTAANPTNEIYSDNSNATTGDLLINSNATIGTAASNTIINAVSANVGIGTSTPTQKLDVAGTIKATGFILPTGAAAGYVLTSQDGNGTASWTQLSGLSQWVTSGSNISYSNGNVGIGTTTPPSHKLEVVGAIKTDGIIMPTGAQAGKVLVSSDANGSAIWQSQWMLSGNNISYSVPYADVTVGSAANLKVSGGGDFLFTPSNTSFVYNGTFFSGSNFRIYGNYGDVEIKAPSFNVTAGQTNISGSNLTINAPTIFNSNVTFGNGSTVNISSIQTNSFSATGGSIGTLQVSNSLTAPIANLTNLMVSGVINTGTLVSSANIYGVSTSMSSDINTEGNFNLNGLAGTNYIQFPDGTKQFTAASTPASPFIISATTDPVIIVQTPTDQRAIIGIATELYGYSTVANTGDLVIGTVWYRNNGDFNLVSGTAGKSIKLATRPTGGNAEITRMEITGSGQVKIGTGALNPGSLDADYKLAVYGKIVGTEIIASAPSNWSDYVFADDFKLMDLKDVSKFIEKNKHLPGIPSEKDVKAKGINMADMDALLLAKIEQLTLYVIEQQKEIQALKEAYSK